MILFNSVWMYTNNKCLLLNSVKTAKMDFLYVKIER